MVQERERGSGAATREAITAAARRSVVRSYKVKEGRREGGPLALWLAGSFVPSAQLHRAAYSFLPSSPLSRLPQIRVGGEGKALLAATTNKYQRGPGNGGRMIELSPEKRWKNRTYISETDHLTTLRCHINCPLATVFRQVSCLGMLSANPRVTRILSGGVTNEREDREGQRRRRRKGSIRRKVTTLLWK